MGDFGMAQCFIDKTPLFLGSSEAGKWKKMFALKKKTDEEEEEEEEESEEEHEEVYFVHIPATLLDILIWRFEY